MIDLLLTENLIQVIGLHCHVGSTIRDASVYATVTLTLLQLRDKVVLLENIKSGLLINELIFVLFS